MRTALLQILPEKSEAGNLAKGARWCRKAKEAGADIALFPEMWSCGYALPESAEAARRLALPRSGAFVNFFSDLARKLQMAVCITFLEKHASRPQNSLCLFDRSGKEALHYAKVHTCDFGEEKILSAGDGFYVCDLDTAEGNVKVGAMICYDREFPESARILMLKGAEIVLVPNACPMEINRLSQLRGRAYENMFAVATANYPKGQPDCNGHSTVFDGIAYQPGSEDARDTCILEAGEEEGLFLADIDLNMLRKYRESEVHGNAYRRPELYGMLTDREVREPFIRKDKRKP